MTMVQQKLSNTLSCTCVLSKFSSVANGTTTTGKLSDSINSDASPLSSQHLLTNDRHLQPRRLQIPAGQISFMMDRNLLQPSRLIGLWLSASLSSLDSRRFWQWLIADTAGPISDRGRSANRDGTAHQRPSLPNEERNFFFNSSGGWMKTPGS